MILIMLNLIIIKNFKINSLIINRRKNNDIKNKANIHKKMNKMKNSMKAFPK